jgi:hypothetical protein
MMSWPILGIRILCVGYPTDAAPEIFEDKLPNRILRFAINPGLGVTSVFIKLLIMMAIMLRMGSEMLMEHK